MNQMKCCTKCGSYKELSEFNRQKTGKDGYRPECRKCDNKRSEKRNREVYGHLPMSENKKCPSYLGVAVAERLCRHLFKDVLRMPYRNKGFDFICAKNLKIDVKSACITLNRQKYPVWIFGIKENQIADYFLLLAFDNRTDLKPLHQWLIPTDVLKNLVCTTISPSTIHKWDKYRQPIDQARICCNTMKSGL